MAKKQPDTIENRVYLFESLARGYLEARAEELDAKNPERRERAMRALADLAYVSCAVADTATWKAESVRQRVLQGIKLDRRSAPASDSEG
jgi:hypothetical protein